MNATFAAALARELATLTRIVGVPIETLGYGRDLACVADVDPNLAEVDPASPTAIVQATIRRFTTPRGALVDDADYGLDIRSITNRGATRRDILALSGMLRGEATKDDRIESCGVSLTATLTPLGARLDVGVSITPADPDLREFAFTFAVTDADVLTGTINNG